jgi:hypothetical protein
METKPDYQAGDKPTEVRCHECSALFGVEIHRDGRTLLQMGAGVNRLELYSLHGWHDCPATGERMQIHWDSSDVIMRRILRRRKEKPAGQLILD